MKIKKLIKLKMIPQLKNKSQKKDEKKGETNEMKFSLFKNLTNDENRKRFNEIE